MSGKAIAARALFVAALAGACGSARAQPPPAPRAPVRSSCAALDLAQRVLLASRIYGQVTRFFPELSQERFDAAHAAYIERIVRADDRRELTLASMELLASLGDGHTWFSDRCLDRQGGAVGFIAHPIAGRWTVVRSQRGALRIGDVIVAVDGTSIDDFFRRQHRYIAASSDREAAFSLFDLPVLFPPRFRLTLADRRQVVIDRSAPLPPEPAPRTEGRWLVGHAVAYIRIPTFQIFATQSRAVEYLEQFRRARTIIVDLRGNPGAGYASVFKATLMDRPYRAWTRISATHGGDRLLGSSSSYPQQVAVTASGATVRPDRAIPSGRLILLVDRRCTSGCEDLVMPFKTTGRATLIGETTGGAFSETARTDLGDGMVLNVTAVRNVFPDGSRFEGAGIAPDIAVATTAADLRASRDPVLRKALEIANR
jgi:carboxyl-terminal processing protease